MLTTQMPPEISPVTLHEAKEHLKLDEHYEDSYLEHLIQTATQLVEEYLNRSLIKQTLHYVGCGKVRPDGLLEIILPRPNILSILSVKYIHSQTVRTPVKRYQIVDADLQPKLVMAYQDAQCEVIYEAGYGLYPKHIPAPIRHAILLILTYLYENRYAEALSQNFIQYLLSPYKTLKGLS